MFRGATRWWWQRMSAVLLVLLGFWWLWSLWYLAAADYVYMRLWLREPPVSLALWLMMALLFLHGWLGLKIIIEDYLPNTRLRQWFLWVLNGLVWFAMALTTALLLLIQQGRT
jgi:succinate dehydrogenase / fumarate reductase membrane anchor subunit